MAQSSIAEFAPLTANDSLVDCSTAYIRLHGKAFLFFHFGGGLMMNGWQARNLEGWLIVERPVWNRSTGDLVWLGATVLHLSEHAAVAVELLDEFQRLGWIWVINDPLGRDTAGDPTLSRRHALLTLNHQQAAPSVHFASLRSDLICWYPEDWLCVKEAERSFKLHCKL